METHYIIAKSSIGNYYLRSIPGFKRYKQTYTEDEIVYYPFSDDSVEAEANLGDLDYDSRDHSNIKK